MSSKADRPTAFRRGDLWNAALAVSLAAIAYWQGEVGLGLLRDRLTVVGADIAQVRRDIEAVKQESQRATRSTLRIDGTTRELLKEQKQRRDTSGAFRWP
jgi:hypothetical protein